MLGRWKRPKDLLYIERRKELRARALAAGLRPDGGPARVEATFHMPVPPSCSRLEKARRLGKPHIQRPDLDNLIKALLDALWAEDAVVHSINASKVWAPSGAIEVAIL